MDKATKQFIAKKNRQGGRAFEAFIIKTCDAYRAANVADINKLPEPKRYIPVRKQTIDGYCMQLYRIIHLPSPFDFYGTLKTGQSVYIETKRSTKKNLLIQGDKASGGILSHQLLNLVNKGQIWGSVAFLLWDTGGDILRVDWQKLKEIYESGRKHIKKEDGVPVEFKLAKYVQGKQYLSQFILDFLNKL